MGVAANVLGIIGLVFCVLPMAVEFTLPTGLVLGVIALVLGLSARRRAAARGSRRGPATAGVVLGSVAVVTSVILYACCVFGLLKMAEVGRLVGEEFKPQQGGEEFHKAMQRVKNERKTPSK